MNEDYKELVEYLDGKFTKIDENFAKADERFTKIDAKLENLSVGFAELKTVKADKTDIESLKANFNDLQTSVDTYAEKAETVFQELVMFSSQTKRHEKWLVQIAGKLGMKLEF